MVRIPGCWTSALFLPTPGLGGVQTAGRPGKPDHPVQQSTVTAENLKDYPLALSYLDSLARHRCSGRSTPQQLTLATTTATYLKMGEPDSTIKYMKHHEVLKDSLLNIEKVRAIADVQEKYEREEGEDDRASCR